MIWKCAWLAAAVIEVILLSNLTKQHYIPPTDFCAFAKVCNHTGEALCGVEKKNENSRLFLDECDLYEYNCDNHKDYTETNIEKCTLNATVTSSTKSSTITTLVSGIQANVTMAKAFKTVNTTESSMKTAPETISTTNSSSNIACVCSTIICPNITISITSSTDDFNISSINTTVSSTNTTPFINSTEEASIASVKMANVLTNTTTSIEEIASDTSTEALTKITSTKAVTNVTVTEATTELITIQATINATEGTILSSTSTVTTSNVTCTSNPTPTTTEEMITSTLSVPISESASKTIPTNKFEKNTTGKEEIKISQAECKYPTYCNRPRTWETTAKGETRDFYQILRAQFGDRVKVLRDTTHFPRHIAEDFRSDDGFQFGYHNEKMNEIK